MQGGRLIITSVSVFFFNVGGFWQLSVSVLGLLVECCDSCDTSFRPRTHAHTRKKQHIKPSNPFWKHNPRPPSRVFALSGTRAMLLTFHSIPGPRVGTDTDLPPPPTVLKITPTKHTAVPAEILIKSFTSLTSAAFSSLRLYLPALLVTPPFSDVISRWFADGKHLFCHVMKIRLIGRSPTVLTAF